jgi:putative transposase
MTVTPILVTGAAGGIQGSTGFHVTRLLLDRGYPVRAFVHRLDERSDRLRTLGAEVVDGDLRDFRSVAAAMGGIQRAYFAYPVQEGLLEAAATFAASARATGVEQVVNLSQWLQTGGEQPTPHQARHWLTEQIFDWADVGAVHLDATVFYENLLTWALLSLARAGLIELPWGPEGTAIPMVAAEDVARVAAAVLTGPVLGIVKLLTWRCGCEDWSVVVAARYKGYRYPIEVIGHAVWLYHRFALSLRDVEELMVARGVVVSHETIRSWCAKFGPDYANQLRRRRARPGDKWHLDEVFIRINGKIHYLWRAVDQDGNVLDILVQPRRDATAAKKFFRRLLKGLQYLPRVVVTDGLRSYQVAHRELVPSVTHRRSKYLNNRAENSHQPTRVRERVMKRFASPGQAQRFLFAFSHIREHFRPRRHLISAAQWRTEMTARFAVWDQVITAAAA